ncbi:hypothetical protein BGW38_001339 [Lunasporangiospora selenospora]|uniref:Uncharacterized protein n=1 Tax=Lunasporangiospora selenospora TaxID=979761 RepID=A0A9P6KEC4_9FUNG|nr:hypothetical protein BGW38_001339 [Lunasporangiospora selenospora]
MFGFGSHEDAHSQIYGGQAHESSWSHELIAGAAAFEAMRAYENKNGGSHSLTKEILVGLAGAEADKLFETKGLDYLDRRKAKEQAEKQAEMLYDSRY